MNNQYDYTPPLPATPFTFSILVTNPIRRDLPFCPVSAMILPLASVDLHFASMIIVGLDMLMSFLFKRSLVQPPNLSRKIPNPYSPRPYPVTLTLEQLNNLIIASNKGLLPMPSPILSDSTVPGQGSGPVGGDEPLFPDNLSISLSISAPFAPFDGSPDTSFNVPLFEVPGAPGNLLIVLGLLIAQFFIEQAGIGTPNGIGNGGDSHAVANPA